MVALWTARPGPPERDSRCAVLAMSQRPPLVRERYYLLTSQDVASGLLAFQAGDVKGCRIFMYRRLSLFGRLIFDGDSEAQLAETHCADDGGG